MINHTNLELNSFGRSRALALLIGKGAVTLGGHKRLKIFGTLACASGKRMKVGNRIFFKDKQEAVAAGYRPCGHCMRADYLKWKNDMSRTDQLQPTENLLPHNGEAYLFTGVFTGSENEFYLNRLQQEIFWKQEPVKMFGKEVMQPRLTAWYGDEGKAYTYSGITMKPLPWASVLLSIKEKTEEICKRSFNSCLLNFYRDGNDSMGWHRDNEKELGEDPAIASVSFGAERPFQFRSYENKKEIVSVMLPSGSILFMTGTTQMHWQHALPKSKKPTDIRINLTFRNIL